MFVFHMWWKCLRLDHSYISYVYLCFIHYDDVIMTTIASQFTSLTVVYSTVYSDADQRKHQSSASLAFVWNSPHKWPVTRKMFPFDDVIMSTALIQSPQPWYRLCACHTLQEWINDTFVRECFAKVFDVVTGKSVEVIKHRIAMWCTIMPIASDQTDCFFANAPGIHWSRVFFYIPKRDIYEDLLFSLPKIWFQFKPGSWICAYE